MKDGAVLGVHNGMIIEYDESTLAPLGMVVSRDELQGRRVAVVDNGYGGSTCLLYDDENNSEVTVVQPNEDGTNWRKVVPNKKYRTREKRNVEAKRERTLRDFEDAESREARMKDALNHEKKRTASLKDELREATEKLVEYETLLEEETKKLGEVEAKVKAEELAIERERAHAKDAKRRNDEMKITLKVAEKTIEEITLFLNSILEKMILKNPEQWIWTHDRWKK